MSSQESSPHQPHRTGAPLSSEMLNGIGTRLMALPRFLRLMLPPLWGAGLWWLSSQPGSRIREDEAFFQSWTYNTGHAFLYGILALLCVACLPRREGGVALSRGRVFWILGLVMAYGCIDELHQSWVPDRSASGLDLLTDLVGACATLAVIFHLDKRSPEDPVAHATHLRRLLWIGLILSWAAGLAATVLDT
ncbi:MAG: VanZ family protein [Planctomycetota bacterium]|nr:VanZ family protein [Planctomycetota bacterium]